MRIGGSPLKPARLHCLGAAVVSLVLASLAPASAGAFGISAFGGSLTTPSGTELSQAGAHPDVTTYIHFPTVNAINSEGNPYEITEANPKDIEVNLPPGIVGDPQAVPTCTQEQLRGNGFAAECPPNTQVGETTVTFYASFLSKGGEQPVPVYNMQPPVGRPAQFAFNINGVLIFINAKVRDGGDYGVTADINGISQGLALGASKLTLWGVPSDPSHDAERGGPSTAPRLALMTSPTQCSSTPLTYTMSTDSWQEPDVPFTASFDRDFDGNQLLMTGCERLAFDPTITVAPDTAQADTPAGLTVEVKMPQDGLLNPEGIAPADLKNTTVTLPAGVVINPGQAAGLVACQPAEDAVGSEGPSHCPSASKVGTVQITTPLLPEKLEGSVYILPSNPPDLQLLIAASADGVNLKLVGDVHLDAGSGQLTTTFLNTPQLPFSDLKLNFSGGAQAALATPLACGTYSTSSVFTPWSTPYEADRFSTDSFDITSGPGGAACASQPAFEPKMIAGAGTDQAGGFTDFSMLIQRGDGQQRISRLQFKTPEGLLGMISSVPLCGEPAAAQGNCPAATQIGHTIVQAGPGPYPLVVPQPGQPPAPIYLTGPYDGAPYGLSIAVPVVAGPFNLGTIVVRAAISVDSRTSQLTITTGELPSVLDGIPTDLRTIDAVIDRPKFMFNPTSCAPMSFSGTAMSTEGASASLASHFQVGSCQSLKFKPRFSATTSGRTSRLGGASLDVRIVYPTGPLGHNQASQQSNVAKVKVDLPKQLPSRLSTLQHACTAAVFETNPANCPAGSVVGTAKAVTPVLPVPLTGPAYFVSHGGEAFPSLEVLLQGDGVRVDLEGSTFISKKGITSSTFKSVPDVPISSFELYLPEGPNSALAAYGNLCRSKLSMPTIFVAQNGAEIHQNTPIAATQCPQAKSFRKARKASRKKARGDKAALTGTASHRGLRRAN
jgi:hypothetical protein